MGKGTAGKPEAPAGTPEGQDEQENTAAASEGQDGAPAASEGPMMLVRRGRYVGTYSRGFHSVPFGEQLLARPGQEYDVRESFKYLWNDPQFDSVWEWLGPETLVPAVNEGQVAAK